MRRHFWLLLLILLLAAVLRIYNINLQSLWIDEGFTWNLTQYSDPWLVLRNDVHPPLYFLAMDAWIELAGTSVIALRFFSVLPGLLSVAVIFQLGREIDRQRGVAESIFPVLTALLLTLADAEIFLAQEARSYTWQVLFASSSMWGFLHWSRTRNRRSWFIWLLSTIALIYTFYLGAFIGVAQGIYTLLFLRRRRRIAAIFSLVLAAISLLPWLLLTGGDQSSNISFAEWIRPDAFGFWLADFVQRYFSGQWALVIGLCALGVFGIFIIGERVRFRPHPTAILLILWLGVPLLLTLLGNEFAPLYQPRRISQIVPAIALLTALGLVAFPRFSRWFLVIVLLIYGLFTVDYWRYKQPWRDFVAETVDYLAPGTPLLFEVGGDDYAPRYHYAEALPFSHDLLLEGNDPGDIEVPLLGLTTWRQLDPDGYSAGLPGYIQAQEHLWLFYWSSDSGALDWLDTFGFQRTAAIRASFNPDVYLYRYDRLPEEPIAAYQNGMILREVLISDSGLVELIWQTEEMLIESYTTSVVLLNEAGEVVTQQDSPPLLGESATNTWEVGNPVYDPKPLETQTLPAGDYQVGVVVYSSVDGEIRRILTEDEKNLLIVSTIHLP